MNKPVPAGWVIPKGWTYVNVANCRSCGVQIAWCTTPTGYRSPVEPDGKSHFATCPQAADWRKPPGGRRS